MKSRILNAIFLLAVAAPLSFSIGCGATHSTLSNTDQAGNGGTNTGAGSGNSGNSGSGNSGSGNSGSGSTNTGNGGSGNSGSGGSTGTGSGNGGSGDSGSGNSGSGNSGDSNTDPYPAAVPADAVKVGSVQALKNWTAVYDTGTSGSSGSSSGAMDIVDAPSESGKTREFKTSYTHAGGERYYVSFGKDTQSTNFFYDVWVYYADAPTQVANLEFDMNQVMSNGQTVIFGFQCDGYSKTWDYTENAGTPEHSNANWLHSKATCNPRNWSTNAWHHVQISYSRDDAGTVTYNSVWLDDAEQHIDATVPSAFALGWASDLLTNFQVDGLGTSGTATVYLDNMTIYRW